MCLALGTKVQTEHWIDFVMHEAYWVSMAQRTWNDTAVIVPNAKFLNFKRAPLINIPISRPWQVVAVDTLEVPVSTNNNSYLCISGTRLLHQVMPSS